MSYRIPEQLSPVREPAHTEAPQFHEVSADNQRIAQAQEKIKRLIDQQHADLEGKFDQIRRSLTEKEARVHQELNEILNSRLNELEECARNINSLNDTYKLNQQKLDTKTLGDVNFKILTTITESIEAFRKKINLELNIRILWGSQNIEQSIQKICTISYASDVSSQNPRPVANHQKTRPSPLNIPGSCKCLYCHIVFQTPEELTKHPCVARGTPAGGRQTPIRTPLPPKEVPPVQSATPIPPVQPIPGPAGQHRTGELGDVAEVQNPGTPMSLFFCQACQEYLYSLIEIENHNMQVHGIKPNRSPRPDHDLPPPRAARALEHGGQQQLNAAVESFVPVVQEESAFSPLDRPQVGHAFSKPVVYPQPQPLPHPHIQPQPHPQSHPLPHPHLQPQPHPQPHPLPHPHIQPQHIQQAQMPTQPQPQPVGVNRPPFATAVASQYAHPVAAPQPYQDPAYAGLQPALPPQAPFTQPQPGIQYPKHKKRLIWLKQTPTLAPSVSYFDNFDGCFQLFWDKRRTCYVAEAELEEGEHYGQLSIPDSDLMYAVHKFEIQLSDLSQPEIVLDCVQMHF